MMIPLKMQHKHLPNFLWSISFPFCLKSCWSLGASFNKQNSCKEVSPLMTYPRKLFQVGWSQMTAVWGQESKRIASVGYLVVSLNILWHVVGDDFSYIFSGVPVLQWSETYLAHQTSSTGSRAKRRWCNSSDLQKITYSTATEVIY